MVVSSMNTTLTLPSGLGTNHTASQTSEDALNACVHYMLSGMIEQMGWLFYYIKPNSSLYMSVDEVPNYEVQVFSNIVYLPSSYLFYVRFFLFLEC